MKNYIAPTTLREAWSIYNTSPSNIILGGCAFLRLGKKNIGTGIDLCNLNLDYVRIHETYVEIGAMTNLRTLETNVELSARFGGILGQSVSNIVGVSFRNTATVGGSVFGRYGFSDLLTALLALKAEVELYKGGILTLEAYLNLPPHFDILISIRIPQLKEDHIKTNILNTYYYEAFRHSKGDFPILTTAIAHDQEGFRIAVGARPMRATYATKTMDFLNQISNDKSPISSEIIEYAAELASNELTFGTNMRAGAEYRKHLCKVLVQRGLNEVLK